MIGEELWIAAQAFCEDNSSVLIMEDKMEVHLRLIFKWYGADFVDSVSQLPSKVVSYLHRGKKGILQWILENKKSIALKFMPYDWSTNVSNSYWFWPIGIGLWWNKHQGSIFNAQLSFQQDKGHVHDTYMFVIIISPDAL